jgi:two-component system response regulator MprA
MSERTVLIVDDDPDLRGALTDALTDEGYPVASARDGLDAMTYLRSHHAPALILLDWMMPNCNGPCFRRLQVQDPRLSGIPVLVLSADRHIDIKAGEMGLTNYLVKPVEVETLLGVIQRYVSG